MKKSLFGYSAEEVNRALSNLTQQNRALREKVGTLESRVRDLSRQQKQPQVRESAPVSQETDALQEELTALREQLRRIRDRHQPAGDVPEKPAADSRLQQLQETAAKLQAENQRLTELLRSEQQKAEQAKKPVDTGSLTKRERDLLQQMEDIRARLDNSAAQLTRDHRQAASTVIRLDEDRRKLAAQLTDCTTRIAEEQWNACSRLEVRMRELNSAQEAYARAGETLRAETTELLALMTGATDRLLAQRDSIREQLADASSVIEAELSTLESADRDISQTVISDVDSILADMSAIVADIHDRQTAADIRDKEIRARSEHLEDTVLTLSRREAVCRKAETAGPETIPEYSRSSMAMQASMDRMNEVLIRLKALTA